jgi:protein-S-isoprenylcysteine O-methyltransferase Ste14
MAGNAGCTRAAGSVSRKGAAMAEHRLPPLRLLLLVLSRLVFLFPLLGVMFFLPAGTLDYWEAWLYLGLLLLPMLLVLVYLWRNAPDLLERRMRLQERESGQRKIISISYLFFILVFLLPGYDHRCGWSEVPVSIVLLADAIVLLGYGIFFLVLRENRFASRIVEVDREQEVIRTGPYAVVRHPMYLGLGLLYLFTPIGLGSYWAFLPGLLIIPILIARILDEEKVLRKGLGGYAEYTRTVRYRLIPGLW